MWQSKNFDLLKIYPGIKSAVPRTKQHPTAVFGQWLFCHPPSVRVLVCRDTGKCYYSGHVLGIS